MTMRRHCLDDVAPLPRRLRYPHGCAGSVTWHWEAVGVVIRVCREGCGRLVVVVAVGESGEVAGPVGVDGGGGWNGKVVGCLLIVDDNKSTKRASVFADARFGCS